MAATKPPLTEEAIRNLEDHIPDVAAGATYAAYLRALSAGNTVIEVEGSQVVETFPDGSKAVRGQAQKRRKVQVGATVRVRRVGSLGNA